MEKSRKRCIEQFFSGASTKLRPLLVNQLSLMKKVHKISVIRRFFELSRIDLHSLRREAVVASASGAAAASARRL